MNSRKTYNSILFLTSLGLYLGLVAVGATPVLGHAAMTRNFEIADEIEIKDDLDTKPDDTVDAALSMQVYLQDVEYFLDGLRRLNRGGRFDLGKDSFEVEQSTLLPCVANNKVGSYTASKFSNRNEFLRPSLELFGNRLTDGYSLADCLPSERFSGQQATDSRFNFKLDHAGLSVEVAVRKISPRNASQTLDSLQHVLAALSPKDAAPVRKAVADHTSFKARRSQIFVVTRLPRAGLDTLLAKDA